jgi:hypothetical protein
MGFYYSRVLVLAKIWEVGQKYAIAVILPSAGKNLLCKAANPRIF